MEHLELDAAASEMHQSIVDFLSDAPAEDPRTAGKVQSTSKPATLGSARAISSARKEGKPAVEGGGAPLLLSGHGAAKAWPKAEAVYKGVEAETRHPLHEVW